MFQKKNRGAFFLVILIATLVLASCDSVGDKYVGFAQCLKDKGVTMYGAYWCPHCANQKRLFGSAGAAALNYVECDARGYKANPEVCAQKKVTSYPTWEFADGKMASGEHSLEELSQLSSCPLPQSAAE